MGIPVGPRTIVRHEGVFDYSGLYSLIFAWFKDRGYDILEKAYKRGKSAIGHKDEIEWIATLKYNQYIEFQVNLLIVIYSRVGVEVVKSGKKKRMDKARIEIKFSGQMNTDYQEKFNSTKFLRKLKKFYETHVGYHKIGDISDVLYYQIFKLQTEVREFLNMH